LAFVLGAGVFVVCEAVAGHNTPRHRDSIRLVSKRQTADACLQRLSIEIQEQSDPQLQHSHVGEHLSLVNADESLYALNLDDDLCSTTRSGRYLPIRWPLYSTPTPT
jgi:hypothetical protein